MRLSDAEQDVLAVPELHPSATLADLARVMINNVAIRDWLMTVEDDRDVYKLVLPDRDPSLIAFDREKVDRERRDVSLFTWGTDEAEALHKLLTS